MPGGTLKRVEGRGHDAEGKLVFNAFGVVSFDPAAIRKTAVIENGLFSEIGERILPGRDPLRIFEMNLARLSDSARPAEGAIGPK